MRCSDERGALMAITSKYNPYWGQTYYYNSDITDENGEPIPWMSEGAARSGQHQAGDWQAHTNTPVPGHEGSTLQQIAEQAARDSAKAGPAEYGSMAAIMAGAGATAAGGAGLWGAGTAGGETLLGGSGVDTLAAAPTMPAAQGLSPEALQAMGLSQTAPGVWELSAAGAGGALGAGTAAAAAGTAASAMTAPASGGGTINIPGIGDVPLAALGMLAGAATGALGASSKPAGSTTTTQDVPDWLKPYVMGNLNQAGGTKGALLANGTPATTASIPEYLKTVSGAYLDPATNPYLDATYKHAAGLVGAGIDSRFEAAGRYGSGAHQGVLQEGFNNLGTSIFGGNYQAERARQTAAITGAPTFDTGTAGAAFAPYTDYANLFPSSRSTTQPYFSNLPGSILSGALAGGTLSKMYG